MSLVSHRGAAGLAAENSMQAIAEAKKYCPTYIEVDIQCSRDGKFVLLHGEMQQTFRGNRLLQDYNELKMQYPHLLLLTDLLKNDDQRTPFLFDIKCLDDYPQLEELFLQSTLSPHTAFTSPHVHVLRQLKRIYPRALLLCAQPFKKGPFASYLAAKKYNLGGISIQKWYVSPLLYLLCRYSNISIMTFTIDSRIGMLVHQLLYKKILICTNKPNVYRKLFKA